MSSGLDSASKNAPTILDQTDLRKYFKTVVDGNRTHKAKPDPEVFLTAARDRSDFDTVVLSSAALNDDDLFLDDMPFPELVAALPDRSVWPSEHVTDVLIPA